MTGSAGKRFPVILFVDSGTIVSSANNGPRIGGGRRYRDPRESPHRRIVILPRPPSVPGSEPSPVPCGRVLAR